MNTSKWAKAFAIDYKGTLCSDDFEVDNDIFIRDCPFPTLNKGWRNQADYEEGDCSVQYKDLYGSSYTTKCMFYSLIAFIPFCFSLHYLNIVHKNRIAKGSKSINLMEKLFGLNALFTVVLTISGIDIDSVSGIIGIIPHAALVGIGIACVCTVLCLLVGEAVFGCVEYIPGLLPAPAQINSYGSFSGTCNAVKNGLMGVMLLFWMGVGLKFGLGVTSKLESGSAGPSKEAKKIAFMCKTMSVAIFVGASYKFIFIPFRMGKVVVMDYPCSEDAGFVSIVGLLLTFISYLVVLANKPGSPKAKVNPQKSVSGTTTVSTSSSDP